MFERWHEKTDTGIVFSFTIWHELMSNFKHVYFACELGISLFGYGIHPVIEFIVQGTKTNTVHSRLYAIARLGSRREDGSGTLEW